MQYSQHHDPALLLLGLPHERVKLLGFTDKMVEWIFVTGQPGSGESDIFKQLQVGDQHSLHVTLLS
jgi:hypothetical protein